MNNSDLLRNFRAKARSKVEIFAIKILITDQKEFDIILFTNRVTKNSLSNDFD